MNKETDILIESPGALDTDSFQKYLESFFAMPKEQQDAELKKIQEAVEKMSPEQGCIALLLMLLMCECPYNPESKPKQSTTDSKEETQNG